MIAWTQVVQLERQIAHVPDVGFQLLVQVMASTELGPDLDGGLDHQDLVVELAFQGEVEGRGQGRNVLAMAGLAGWRPDRWRR